MKWALGSVVRSAVGVKILKFRLTKGVVQKCGNTRVEYMMITFFSVFSHAAMPIIISTNIFSTPMQIGPNILSINAVDMMKTSDSVYHAKMRRVSVSETDVMECFESIYYVLAWLRIRFIRLGLSCKNEQAVRNRGANFEVV